MRFYEDLKAYYFSKNPETDAEEASTVLPCRHFRPNTGDPHIEKRKKRIGITDIYI